MATASFVTGLPGIRPASGWVLGGFVGMHTGLLLSVHTPAFSRLVARPIAAATAGWVSHSVAATLLMAVVLIGGLLWGAGGLRTGDFGWPTGGRGGWKALNAVLIAYLLWGLAQLLVAGSAIFGLTDIATNPAWMQPLRPSLVGASALAVIAGATLEEVLYRGFFFVHLLLALRRWGVATVRGQMYAALAGSQLFFGMNHIPVGLAAGFEGGVLGLYILQVTLVGVLFAVLFMQTNNLFVPIAVHALINAPVLPFVAPVDASLLVLVLALVLVLVRPVLTPILVHGLGTDSSRGSPSSCSSAGRRPGGPH